MILEKQDVVYIPFDNFKYNDLVIADGNNHIIAGAKPIHDIYVLTETELETLKQEYYGIGVKDGQKSK